MKENFGTVMHWICYITHATCQEEDDSSNDRIRLGTVSVPVGSKPHTMLPALMS